MNKIILTILMLLVLCDFEAESRTVLEFFNNLPSEISNAVATAWENMKKAIKRPVRIKRMGRGGKRTTSWLATSTTSTTEATTISSTSLMLKKLELPVLSTPRWQNLDEWKNQQKPRFAQKSDGTTTPKVSGPIKVLDKS